MGVRLHRLRSRARSRALLRHRVRGGLRRHARRARLGLAPSARGAVVAHLGGYHIERFENLFKKSFIDCSLLLR